MPCVVFVSKRGQRVCLEQDVYSNTQTVVQYRTRCVTDKDVTTVMTNTWDKAESFWSGCGVGVVPERLLFFFH